MTIFRGTGVWASICGVCCCKMANFVWLSILATHQMHVDNRFSHFLSRDLVFLCFFLCVCFFLFFFYSAIILSLPLIQLGQMSVTGDIPVIFGIAKDSLNYLWGQLKLGYLFEGILEFTGLFYGWGEGRGML